jgi:hypothetical protein
MELEGKPHYITFNKDYIKIHSKFIFNELSKTEIEECSPTGILEETMYIILFYLGNKRTELFKNFDELFDLITFGKIRDSKKIVKLRREILSLYSDTTTLYYISRRLAKLLSPEVVEDVKFAYERAELLVLRSSDLYNIYLTEVQNELNDVIKKLTSISFIFMPITAVASIYAVGYDTLNQTLINEWAMIYLLPVMIATIILVLYLKRIKWL